jgi:hypothetical protein
MKECIDNDNIDNDNIDNIDNIDNDNIDNDNIDNIDNINNDNIDNVFNKIKKDIINNKLLNKYQQKYIINLSHENKNELIFLFNKSIKELIEYI